MSPPITRVMYLALWRMKSGHAYVQLRADVPKWQPERMGNGAIAIKLLACKRIEITEGEGMLPEGQS